MRNVVVKVESEKLSELSFPCIAHTKNGATAIRSQNFFHKKLHISFFLLIFAKIKRIAYGKNRVDIYAKNIHTKSV
jgi:polynucleotide 5'-kinase involved in rRNA processing